MNIYSKPIDMDQDKLNNTLLLYGDESSHLDSDDAPYMVIGLVFCRAIDKDQIILKVREILTSHGFSMYSEIKWTKISPSNQAAYLDVVKYFIDNDRIFFRAIMIKKEQIQNELLGQTHGEFYGKMYYQALKYLIINEYNFYENYDNYRVFIDISDTVGKARVMLLQNIIYGMLQRQNKTNKNIQIQEVRSHESVLLQLADLISGAIQFAFRPEYSKDKPGKSSITDLLCKTYGFNYSEKYFQNSKKFNVFFWKGNR